LLSFALSRLDERETVLGGRFEFAPAGAHTWMIDAGANLDLGGSWSAATSYRRALTMLPGGNGFVTGGRMASDAFTLDLSRSNAFARGDRLGVRLMQPLRVTGGGYDMNLPVAFDHATMSPNYERTRMNLAPSGRELDFEAAYAFALPGRARHLAANGFLRRQPGHLAAAADDVGAAIRYTLGF
jgi:hypothetical protein